MTQKDFYEMFDENNVRPNYKHFLERLEKLDQKKKKSSTRYRQSQLSLGMTFNVYNDNQGVELLFSI
jgi:uncharacterized circularly permuted ATP-grasp superfamily protein